MTYSATSTAPLFYYPAIGAQLSNYNFEAALAGTWTTAGSVTPPTRNTSVFKRGVASCNFTPGGGTGTTISQSKTLASTLGWKNTGSLEPWYVYFWARNDSGPGTFRVALVATGGPDSWTQDFTLGSGITTDTTFRLYRAGPFTPTTYAAVTGLQLTLGFTAATTCVLYVDDVYLGHVLDFQDLGPLSDGARLVHPYSAPKTVPALSTKIPNGQYQGVRFNLGWQQFKVQSTIINTAAKATIATFQDYCTDATQFTLWHDRTDETRDYYAKAIIPGGRVRDGFKQKANLWQWEQGLEVSL